MANDNDRFQGLGPQAPAGSQVNLMGINFQIIDPEDIKKGIIPAIKFKDGVETRGLVLTDCAHYCPVDPSPGLYSPRQGIYSGKSYTGKLYCHLHVARCQGCGRTLCTRGNSDAFRVDPEDGNRPQFFCYDCHEKIKWSNMISSFWNGFFGSLWR
jgi:hypothetical protein